MSSVPAMHKYMEKRASKQYQPGQGAKQMNLVFSPEQNQCNNGKYCQGDFKASIHERSFPVEYRVTTTQVLVGFQRNLMAYAVQRDFVSNAERCRIE